MAGEPPTIIEGHGRLLACKRLGMEKVPIIRLDHLDAQARKAYMLAHNQLTMNTGFDMDALQATMDELTDFDMSDFGFDTAGGQPTSYSDSKEAIEDGYEPPDEIEPTVKRGEVWALGEHHVMCGDSTTSDVDVLMGGVLADLLLTDPPYGVDYTSKNEFLEASNGKGLHVNRAVENDAMAPSQERDKLWIPAMKQAIAHASDRCSYYVFSPQGGELMMMMMAISQSGWQLKHTLVWVKNSIVLGRSDYNYQHEPILYGWNKTHDFYGYHPASVMDDAKPDDLRKMKKDDLLAWALAMQRRVMDDAKPDVLRFPKPMVSDLHPTMKPIPLLGYLIGNNTKQGDTVMDLFGGSGSTLIACEQMNRRCRMMEYDPHYCDVIIDRWQRLTGKTAEKVS